MRAGGVIEVGVTVVTCGTATSVRSLVESTARAALASSIRPFAAPDGTVTRNCVAESIAKVVLTPPTRALVTAVKPVPVTVTSSPTPALDGVKPAIANASLGAAPTLLLAPLPQPVNAAARTTVQATTRRWNRRRCIGETTTRTTVAYVRCVDAALKSQGGARRRPPFGRSRRAGFALRKASSSPARGPRPMRPA